MRTNGSPDRDESREDRNHDAAASSEGAGRRDGSGGASGGAATLGLFVRAGEWGDVSLRKWLDDPGRGVDGVECRRIFRQVAEIVEVAHAQGIAVRNVRPSCFLMSALNRVSFIESESCTDSGPDSPEDGPNARPAAAARGGAGVDAQNAAAEVMPMESSPRSDNASSGEDWNGGRAAEPSGSFPMKQILQMERDWYTSPEEAADSSPGSFASDVYCLGVLLFELFCTFGSTEEKSANMSTLKHRVLPTHLLLNWPEEASFCLRLLHPDPSCRPTVGELLRREFLDEPKDVRENHEAAMAAQQEMNELELLQEFLLVGQRRKAEAAETLRRAISCLSSDIADVSRRRALIEEEVTSAPEPSTTGASSINAGEADEADTAGSRKRFRSRLQKIVHDAAEAPDRSPEAALSKNPRVMKNLEKLEAAYFSARCSGGAGPAARRSPIGSGSSSAVSTGGSSVSQGFAGDGGRIGAFLDDWCKYLSFDRLEVRAEVRQGDALSSGNLVCCLSFDRDAEFFASAGINRKIKVFEWEAVLAGGRDFHYPVAEMASRSRISAACWNSYIKSQIASSNFDGAVQVWDVTRGRVTAEMAEHQRRVWSVDFSSAVPTLLASGGDDGCVKLWSTNQAGSAATIPTGANVCCVGFPSGSARFLAVGSADQRAYYYDLRNTGAPLCTLSGHRKAVSYVRFVGPKSVLSASTDSTLKLWDLSACASPVLDGPLRSFTGHTNLKNFVGLSESDGYIATGSETNEVFIYHKAFPMPTMSLKFKTTDPFSGLETNETDRFVSSVCWRGRSTSLVAANSTGTIKILEMV